jgi:peptidoglycan/LPS O-acetylase OafA/YrhL
MARFTFAGFYWRRARRLIPASLFTLACSAAIAVVVLSQRDWQTFAAEAFGALSFTANLMALKLGPDGFHALRHYWSLSLEEQFYFVYPLMLWFIPTKTRTLWLAALAAASLATFAFIGGELAFFLLPLRAWELLAGGLIYSLGFTQPTGLRFKPLERIGDWSYSLYLIHWPLLAFASLGYGWPLPPLMSLAICFLSVSLAALQYEFVEQPFRVRKPTLAASNASA